MRTVHFEAEMVCVDCGYTYTAQCETDGSTGVTSIIYATDENCAECGSAGVKEVE